ncbi:hypothetical protein HHI36_002172 [Cryptolaemus montrouzieri]|uniref:Amine oxidase domain-containing protein n=1 Tax=Cryptolaemus montrouzieri TaxID=559131 RepID=A0ABD2PAG4_9CUCU
MWRLLFVLASLIYGTSGEIIIIGSGAAGIAAASRLLDNNITDFRILEAEDRIGGRIHSFFFGQAFVDIGAEYVHGDEGNLVYELAKDFISPEAEEDVAVYYSGSRKLGDNLVNTYTELERESWGRNPSFVSFGESFLQRYYARIFNQYKNDPEMIAFARDFIRTSECFLLGLESAFSWFRPSSSQNFQNTEGEQDLSWNGQGFKTILEILLHNFPKKTGYHINNKILLNKVVKKIVLFDDCVHIFCEDGSEYAPQHVIFTPSIGVLKANHRSLFVPRLDQFKARAIDSLGYDGVMKVLIEFSDVWWGNNTSFIFVASEENERRFRKEVPFGPIKDNDHWLNWFFYMDVAPNNPKVFIAWIVGPMVPEVEKLSEMQMKKAILAFLKISLGRDFRVPLPKRVIQSKWVSNPNFRGTYSYESVDTDKASIRHSREHLADPICSRDGVPRILFAGEATNPTRYGTVDGAVATGFREADRIADILSYKKITRRFRHRKDWYY